MDSTRGAVLVLTAAALWGTTGTAQSLLEAPLSPLWLGAWRLAAAALCFALWLLATDRAALAPAGVKRLPWPGIVVAGTCMTAYNLAFFEGVRACGVAVGTAVALGSGPLWAGLLQSILQRRPPPLAWWGGTALAVTGVAMMVLRPGAAWQAPPQGLVLCATAGFSYALYTVVGARLVAGVPAALGTAAIFTAGAVLAVPAAAALAGEPAPLPWRSLAVVAWLGAMSTGVAYVLYSLALQRLPVATAVTLALAEPLVAFVLALAVVGERPPALAFAGLVVLLAGLALVLRQASRAPAASVPVVAAQGARPPVKGGSAG